MRKYISILVILLAMKSIVALELGASLAGNIFYGDLLCWKDITKTAKWWYTCDLSDPNIGYADINVPLDENNYPIEVPYEGKGVCIQMLIEVWEYIYPFGEFTLEFEGSGEIQLLGAHSATLTNNGPKKVYKFTISESNVKFKEISKFSRNPRSTTFLRLAITKSEKADPIKNIHVLLPGYGENYSDAEPFTNEFIQRVRQSPYTLLRFMDWTKVNHSLEKTWSDRTLPGSIIQTGGFKGKYPHGVAWEYMIALCNQTGKNMWLNVLQHTQQDYWEKLAELIKNQLDPSLHVWFEFGNEVWNGLFVGYQFAVDEGRRLGLGTVDKAWQYNNHYYTWATVRFGETLERAIGKDRVTPVISGWANGVAWTRMRVEALKDPVINPNNYEVKYVATTTYFGAPGAVDQLLAPGGNWRDHIDLAKEFNMTWISYEGGHGGNMPKSQLKSAYLYALDKLNQHGGLHIEFQFANTWGGHTYGALEYITQPLDDAPKYAAIIEWAQKNNGFTVDIIDHSDGYGRQRVVSTVKGLLIPEERHIFDLQGRLIRPQLGTARSIPVLSVERVKTKDGSSIVKRTLSGINK